MSHMISGLFNDATFQSLRLNLHAAAVRHQAIASNIANVNTPGYKRLDLSANFQDSLKQALMQIEKGQPPVSVPPASLTQAPTQGLARLDGNTVNLDQEFIELTKNQAMFQFASQMMASKYSGMKAAITGRSA